MLMYKNELGVRLFNPHVEYLTVTEAVTIGTDPSSSYT